MIIILVISILLNFVFLYYLLHDTKYYHKVIGDLQEKNRKLLAKE